MGCTVSGLWPAACAFRNLLCCYSPRYKPFWLALKCDVPGTRLSGWGFKDSWQEFRVRGLGCGITTTDGLNFGKYWRSLKPRAFEWRSKQQHWRPRTLHWPSSLTAKAKCYASGIYQCVWLRFYWGFRAQFFVYIVHPKPLTSEPFRLLFLSSCCPSTMMALTKSG